MMRDRALKLQDQFLEKNPTVSRNTRPLELVCISILYKCMSSKYFESNRVAFAELILSSLYHGPGVGMHLRLLTL